MFIYLIYSMEKEKKLESDIIFEKYTKDNVSYNKLMLSLFQDLKGKNFIFNKTKKTKNDLIKNMEKNINNLVKHIKELDENEFIEIYRCLSCIFGAFLGDAIGAYCEFKKPSKQNLLVLRPDKVRAVMQAAGPGRDVTVIPAL